MSLNNVITGDFEQGNLYADQNGNIKNEVNISGLEDTFEITASGDYIFEGSADSGGNIFTPSYAANVRLYNTSVYQYTLVGLFYNGGDTSFLVVKPNTTATLKFDLSRGRWIQNISYIADDPVQLKTINGNVITGTGDIFISTGGTVDTTIIDGSTNAISGNAVYDAIQKLYSYNFGKSYYKKEYFTNTSDFTVVALTATTSSSTNFGIDLTNGSDSFANYLKLNNSITNSQKVKYSVRFTFKTTIQNNHFGISIGRRSEGAWYTGGTLQLQFDPVNKTLTFWNFSISGTPIDKKITNLTFSPNDLLELIYLEDKGVVTGYIFNYTTGKYDFLTIINSFTVVKNFSLPSTSSFCIWYHGGDVRLLQVSDESIESTNSYITCIGDSKTVGSHGGIIDNGYQSLLMSLGYVATYAGDGDRTVETVQCLTKITDSNAKYYILCIGRNDLASGVSTATWQANYLTIVNALKAAGGIVIHLINVGETNTDQTTLVNYVTANYASDIIVNLTGWNNSTMLSSDGVHPNEFGFRYVGTQIISQASLQPSYPYYSTRTLEKIPNNIGAESGLYRATSGKIGLGGTLEQTTRVDTGNNDFTLSHLNTTVLDVKNRRLWSVNNQPLASWTDYWYFDHPGNVFKTKIDTANITASNTLLLPNASGNIPLTVNGQSANTLGAIVLPSDTIPTLGSTNYVNSGGIKTYVDTKDLKNIDIYFKGKTIVWYGDSMIVGAGTGVTSTNRYSALVSARLNATELNLGSNGATIEKRTPVYQSRLNAIDMLSTIPTKTAAHAMIVVAFGTNDIGLNSANYNITNYKTDYRTVLDGIIAKGYSASQVLIIAPYYFGTTGYNSYTSLGVTAADTARHLSFIQATLEIALEYQTMYIDAYQAELKNNPTLLDPDGLHRNPSGHEYLMGLVLNYLRQPHIEFIDTLRDQIKTGWLQFNTGIRLLGTPGSGTNRSLNFYGSSGSDDYGEASFYPTTGTNVGASLNLLPKGTGTGGSVKSRIILWNTDFVANNTNWGALVLGAVGGFYKLSGVKAGTGSLLPIFINATGGDNSTTANIIFNTDNTITALSLVGTGTRMVVATSTGVLSTQAIPTAGTGTVTGVSIVTANGISGSVATSTTTPAITLTLDNIAPTSIASATTVTTQTAGDNSTKIASTAYVQTAVATSIPLAGTSSLAGNLLASTNFAFGKANGKSVIEFQSDSANGWMDVYTKSPDNSRLTRIYSISSNTESSQEFTTEGVGPRSFKMISGSQFLFSNDIAKYNDDFTASINTVGDRAIPDRKYNDLRYFYSNTSGTALLKPTSLTYAQRIALVGMETNSIVIQSDASGADIAGMYIYNGTIWKRFAMADEL